MDVAAEVARLKKEIEGLQKAIASKEKQLGNETFRSQRAGEYHQADGRSAGGTEGGTGETAGAAEEFGGRVVWWEVETFGVLWG